MKRKRIFQIFLVDGEYLLHCFLARCANRISLADTSLQADCIVDVVLEYRADCLILADGHIKQGFIMLDAVEYKLTNDTMCITERNTVINQIISRIGSICKSVHGTFLHDRLV